MSHSQFHSTKLLILRHAWLNLWDKHMTTGRINQVTITLGSPHAHTHTHTTRLSLVCVYVCARPSRRCEKSRTTECTHLFSQRSCLFPQVESTSFFVSEMRPRIVPNSRGAPVGQASFWAVLLLSFSAGLCVALAQVSAQSRFASSPPFWIARVPLRLGFTGLFEDYTQQVLCCGSSQYGASTSTRLCRCGSSNVSVLPLGLAIGKYIHIFLQCDLVE